MGGRWRRRLGDWLSLPVSIPCLVAVLGYAFASDPQDPPEQKARLLMGAWGYAVMFWGFGLILLVVFAIRGFTEGRPGWGLLTLGLLVAQWPLGALADRALRRLDRWMGQTGVEGCCRDG